VSIDGTALDGELSDAERTLYTAPGQWPMTSSAGRLFDVVSALLGVRARITYEAQAAIELEHLSRRFAVGLAVTAGTATPPEPLPPAPIILGVLDSSPWLAALADRSAAGESAGRLGYLFHAAFADALAALALGSGARTVGLTGGVFVNRLLLSLLTRTLAEAGVEVLCHRIVPPGDGGLALGQAAIGHRLVATLGAAAPGSAREEGR
jgi:hydrogenase maturation protein HypF